MLEQPIYWFPAMRRGWGWGVPNRWQGWLTLAAYLAALAAVSMIFPAGQHGLARFAMVALATLGLVGVCVLKGEPQRRS